MNIVITQWALDAYLDLRHKNVFTREEYKQKLRPDALLLRDFPEPPPFGNGKFWSPAEYRGKFIKDGFKMKWHQIGNGRVQLRLPVALIDGNAFLCGAYVKQNAKQEARQLAKFSVQTNMIRSNRYTMCGRLT